MLVDSHCHISNKLTQDQCSRMSQFYKANDITKVVLMSSNHLDYEWVLRAYKEIGADIVVPCFGIHPWYAHLFSFDQVANKREHYESVFKKEIDDVEFFETLPMPIHFEPFFRKNFEKFQKAAGGKTLVIGEIGLDKLFRIPNTGYYGCESSIEPRLTKYRTSIEHQLKLFRFQMNFAFRKNLAVSVHNVKAISSIIDTVRADYGDSTTKIMLHSYTGSSDSLKMLLKYIPGDRVYVSISSILNKERFTEFREVMKNILIESDVSVNEYERQLELLEDVAPLFNQDIFESFLT